VIASRDLPAGAELADALLLQWDLRKYVRYRYRFRVGSVLVQGVRALVPPFRPLVSLRSFRYPRSFRFLRRSTRLASGWSGPHRCTRFFIGSSRCSFFRSTRLAGCYLRSPARRRVIARLLGRPRPSFGGYSAKRVLTLESVVSAVLVDPSRIQVDPWIKEGVRQVMPFTWQTPSAAEGFSLVAGLGWAFQRRESV